MGRLGDRAAVGLSLTLVVGLAWLYLWREASMPSMPGMAPSYPVALAFVMWLVMMAAMMLPSAAPMILLYAAMARKSAERDKALPSTSFFVGGYLLAWAAFSLVAALLQVALQHAAALTPMMSFASKPVGGALFVAAGLYQLTPLKNACLRNCRNPLSVLLMNWRPGAAGALRLGVIQGLYCVGCCWVLMLLLFAVGVMNLGWVVLLAAFVLIEKLLPAGPLAARVAGFALVFVGLGVLLL